MVWCSVLRLKFRAPGLCRAGRGYKRANREHRLQILLRVVNARLLLHYDAFPQAWFNVGLPKPLGAPFSLWNTLMELDISCLGGTVQGKGPSRFLGTNVNVLITE